ncbi:hypothetical protein FRC06_007342 [Ceratobasidium sp. 370]|nr:hypothetical protein FRC06_007342 [Ceratobasidium sp. 370]
MCTAKVPHKDIDMLDVNRNVAAWSSEREGKVEVEAALSPAKSQSRLVNKAVIKPEDSEDQEPRTKRWWTKCKHIANSSELSSEPEQQGMVEGGAKLDTAKDRHTKVKVVEYKSETTGGKGDGKGKATDKGKGVDRGLVELKGKQISE